MVLENFQLALLGNEVRRDPVHEYLRVAASPERYDSKGDERQNGDDHLQEDEQAAIYGLCS